MRDVRTGVKLKMLPKNGQQFVMQRVCTNNKHNSGQKWPAIGYAASIVQFTSRILAKNGQQFAMRECM